MASNLSKDEVIQRIVAAFREHGYEGASLSILSLAAGEVFRDPCSARLVTLFGANFDLDFLP